MNLLTKIHPLILASFLAFTPIYGKDNCPTPEKPCLASKLSKCTPCKPCTPIQEVFPMEPGYSAPSRIAVDRCWDVFTTVSFIYWNPSQENLELGIVGSSDSSYVLNGKFVNLNPGFSPGFKVGLGLNLDRDHWDLFSEYTWFQNTSQTSSASEASSGLSLYPSLEIPNSILSSSYLSGKEKWKLNMNLIDLSIARHYYIGTSLMFHPFFGARGAIISQKLNAQYMDEVSGNLLFQNLSIKRTTHSWGVGPRIGISTDWKLGCGVKMLGKGSGDILFTQYTSLNTKQKSLSSAGLVSGANNYNIRQKNLNYLRGHCDLEFGFSWGSYWGMRKWHTDFAATYNFQIFFNQNMFRCFVDDLAHAISASPSGNLYINGLNISFRVDF